MKKISLSSWAIPQDLEKFTANIRKIGYDGISLGGFKPYGAHPDLFDTPQKKAALKKVMADNQIEVADFAVDLWSLDFLTQTDEWMALYARFLEFADEMDYRMIRIDSGSPPILPNNMTYDEVKKRYVKKFKEMAKQAAAKRMLVVWEFEPGFIVNEPANIIEMVKAVDEPNFKLLFDTCHAYNLVRGSRHIQPGMTLDGGILEFIGMCKDLIGLVHLIDSDGTLNETETSTHVPFGLGNINFDEVIPALLGVANYTNDWWSIDLCEWPDAWTVAEDCFQFVNALNTKYCK